MQQRDDVVMFGMFGPGGLILLLLVKIYMEQQGHHPHPIGHDMAKQALEKRMS